ncbi:MAG: L-histidine N(alpha)-methyltransferase [Candidatus Eremiobacter antarcticus]|nr:L-histidine N(alpha)-methyltransferase [Candidatus Eremiobacteraeota bacterium]MBC5808309.1 L-histidine N(alpha)-methyltransferase [Candidatus Eremiobacteraeota bacterium]
MVESASLRFAEDVRHGLTSAPKSLPSKYFYDALGSMLFEAICLLPEYYLTRAEAEIFNTHADAIVDAARPDRLIELGSGSAMKTRILLDAVLRRRSHLEYVAIDISQSALESTAKALESEYPGLTVRRYHNDYLEGLTRLAKDSTARSSPGLPSTPDGRALALFLGSNIGNFEPAQARAFLQSIRAVLKPGDRLLLGTDLKKDATILEAAYDDALGVTAAFNLNLLARINRELAGDIAVRSFRHVAIYNEAAGRVEMHLQSRSRQTFTIGAIGLEVRMAEEETIHTESSHKFSPDEIAELARSADLAFETMWTDSARRFACSLLRVA